MTEHLDALFSAAYDGDLGPAESARFERHLVGCSACAGGYADFRAAIDAVHELGPVRMPHPVRLPASPPLGVSRTSLADRLLGWRRPMVALAGIAAAALIVVVATGQLHLGGGAGPLGSTTAGSGGGAGPARLPSVASTCSGSCAFAPDQSVSCVAQQLSVDAGSAGQVPAGFNNSVTQRDAQGVILLATPSKSYGRGETVLVYARFIDSGTGVVDLPCAGLLPAAGAKSAAGAPSHAPSPNRMAAVPADASVGGGPLLRVTIPNSAMPGDTLEVVADVPSSTPGRPATQVSLSVQVT